MTDILVVDDSLTVRMALVETLEEAGFTVRPCATGGEARRALTEDTYLLAILDLLLPDDDGIDLLKLIRGRAETSDMAVIMLSSEAEVQNRIRGLAAGADDYIGKPYDAAYLVGRARDHVRRLGGAVAHTGHAILLVDDSPTFRAALQEILEKAGYDTLLAESGEEGLRLAADARPAAMIVDGSLPGMDGATVIRRIRLDAALRQIPCLMLTGSIDAADELQALDAGADAYIRKGEESAVILARLKALLRGVVGWESKPSPESLTAPKRVLAVDDDPVYLHQLARILQSEGFEVQLAPNGEEALQLLALQPVDCLVLDLHLPGIDGLETCRRIKAAPGLRDVPVLMLTGTEDRRSMIEGYGAGADDFLTKASDAEVLRARVLAQIRRKQGQEETRRIREELLRRELEAAEERAARQAAEERAAHAAELELKNQELEAFSYSVAHDLRAPLRGIDGFSLALLEDYEAALDETGKGYLTHIRNSTVHMGRLIDDLLKLARVTRSEFIRSEVDLSVIAQSVTDRLREFSPDREVTVEIEPRVMAAGDSALLTVALENLIGNAWKFTAKRENARISFGAENRGGQRVFAVRDNGAGFDMAHVGRLFNVFTRLHSAKEFEGTGIGLATVLRVVRRHGGKIWAEGEAGKGASFFFTLEAKT